MKQMFPFSCPVCARISDYPITDMVEGADLNCPFCKCRVRLHGHMLAYVQQEIEKLKNPEKGAPAGPD